MKLWAMSIGLAMLGVAAVPAQELPEWVLKLSRVKRQARDNFQRIPNYVCQETVERFEKVPRSQSFVKVDTLRFEVAHVGNKELLALPGAGGFQDAELSAYAHSGIMGTGAFSATARNLFVADTARITGHEEGNALLPAPLRYDFEIPLFQSGWELMSGRAKATVGSQGTFWADPETLDLVRIEEHAVDIPGVLGMAEVEMTMDYGRVRIGASSVLLPQSAVMRVTNRGGGESRNDIEFSGCREFTSESTIRFEGPVGEPPVVKKK